MGGVSVLDSPLSFHNEYYIEPLRFLQDIKDEARELILLEFQNQRILFVWKLYRLYKLNRLEPS